MTTIPATHSTTLTAAEFIAQYGHETGVELVRGQIRRNPVPGTRHDYLELKVAMLIGGFIQANRLGWAMCGETFIRMSANPPSIRAADITFISYSKIPETTKLPDGVLEIAPDLVIEIRSPSDRMKAINEKVHEYLDAGVTVVMVVDPSIESMGVFRADELPFRFHNGDTVTLPEVLPGFSAPVKAFFE
jgi:Uma2 family endonuclease